MDWALRDSDNQPYYNPDMVSLNTSIVSSSSYYPSRTNSISSIASSPVKGEHPQCEYCKTKNNEWLVKCIDENCGRWFCNSEKVKGATGSHIYLHLSKMNHKVIELHPGRHYKIGKIRCRECKSDKVFSLGMHLPYKTLLCRDCFIVKGKDVNEWSSLIKEKKIDSELISNRKKNNKKNSKPPLFNTTKKNRIVVSVKDIEKIENEFGLLTENDMIEYEQYRIYDVYPDIFSYKFILFNLLAINNKEEQKIAKRNAIKNIVFNMADKRNSGFFFGVDYGCKFSQRDKIIITCNKFEKWKAEGSITKIEEGKYFIDFSPIAPASVDKINMEIKNDNSTFERLDSGINKFSTSTQDPDILKILLGHITEARMSYYHKIPNYSIPGEHLNTTQMRAIRKAMKYKCSIIQGPPGTGKTQTIVTIVYQIINLWRQSQEYLSRERKTLKLNQMIQEAKEKSEKAAKESFSVVSKINDLRRNNKNKITKKSERYDENLNNHTKNISQEIDGLYKNIDRSYIEYDTYKNIQKLSEVNSFYKKISELKFRLKNIDDLKIEKNELLNASVFSNRNINKNEKAVEINQSDGSIMNQSTENIPSPLEKRPSTLNYTIISPENKDKMGQISECYNSDHKVLVCAASNTAINVLKNRLIKKNINALQIYARYKEEEYKDDENSLHYKKNKILEQDENYRALEEFEKKLKNDLKTNLNQNIQDQNIQDQIRKDLNKISKDLSKIRNDTEKKILASCEVVCCTCLSTHLSNLSNFKFQHVIFDEATQALEVETLLCLIKGSTHLVLVGDINQLGSVVQSKKASALGLDVPLIERLTDLGVPQTFLSIQYRMHPKIAEFSNTNFYNNKINNGVTEQNRKHKRQVFPDIVKYESTFFYNIDSSEECLGNGDSYLNRHEAEGIKNILSYMNKRKLPGSLIAIITFYDGQRGFLSHYLKRNFSKDDQAFIEDVEIMSVDSSQGKEKDYIILSCVRSNTKVGVGFLEEYRRLNVAMTRAKYGLIVCGNLLTLLSSRLWSKLIYFYAKQSLLFTGNFEKLERLEVELGPDSEFNLEKKKKYRHKKPDFELDIGFDIYSED